MKLVFAPDFPALDAVADKTDNWTVRENWVSALVKGVAVLIKRNTVTDGMSVPRITWRVMGHPFSKATLRESLAHDALYMGELLSRSACDRWYYDALVMSGTQFGGGFKNNVKAAAWRAKCALIWSGVRAGGGVVWARHTHDSVDLARAKVRLLDSAEYAALKTTAGHGNNG